MSLTLHIRHLLPLPYIPKPALEPARGLGDVGGRAGIGKSHELLAAGGVEVVARRRGDADLVEHAAGQLTARGGVLADVGVDIEGAVGRQDVGQSGLGQFVEQDRPVGRIHLAVSLQLLGRIERAEGCVLGDHRRADEQVLRETLDRSHEALGHHHPADPPARHREVFGETIDDDGLVRILQRRVGGRVVGQTVIDLV